MPEMTLAEAAAWAGKGRPAILKAIKRQHNRLSARQDDKGQWWIDPAELARVYEPGNRQDASAGNARSSEEQADAQGREALLRELVELAKQDAAEARKERDDWKEQAGKWEREAEAVRLITHQTAAPEAAAQAPAVIETPAAPPAPRGFRAKLGRLIAGR